MSAAIRKLHYKPDLEELSIWFGPDFRRYKYYGVPEHMFEALRDADSRGRFFNAFIKGRFECSPVAKAPDPSKRWQDYRSAS